VGKQESMTLDEQSSSLRPGGPSGDGKLAAASPGGRPAAGLSLGPWGARFRSLGQGRWGARWPSLGRWGARFRSLSRGRRVAVASSVAVLAVVAAITAIGSTSGRAAKAPAHPAPAFTLPVLGHSGEHISLAGFAGRPLVINFFASWCTPCRAETPRLAQFYLAAHGHFTLIGIDANDKASEALKFTRAAGVTYPVAFDPYPMHTTISYGVDALPQTFFLNARHRIVKIVRGAVTDQELRAGLAEITTPATHG
jgi:cytochrome c biogenesis protein CcmG, thiol:disulfide interchange protein DsbE